MKRKWFDAKTVSNLAVVLAGIAFFFLLYRFDAVRGYVGGFVRILSPFIGGFMIAYLLNTPICFFERRVYGKLRFRRALSIATVYVLAIAVVAVLLTLVLPQVWKSAMELGSNMERYLAQLQTALSDFLEQNHIQSEGLAGLVLNYQDMMTWVGNMAVEALPHLVNWGMALGSGIVAGITALIASIYMLFGKERLVRQVKKLIYAAFPTENAAWFLGVCRHANHTFLGFINGKLVDSAIIGVLCFILNLIFQIPYNVLIAVIIGVTNIIPFFGPIVGAVPCVLILLIVDPWAAVRFGILVLALQQFDGNILGPKILGDSTGLSAIWVLVAIVVGGGLFGFPGMILGVPTFAVLYALVREWVKMRLEKKGIDEDGQPLAQPPGPEEKTEE